LSPLAVEEFLPRQTAILGHFPFFNTPIDYTVASALITGLREGNL
jgi:hypothetical protein